MLKEGLYMVGRNEPCPCGSGKKYKKCCFGKDTVSVEEVFFDELERVLQTFFDEYPERKDFEHLIAQFDKWKATLDSKLASELIEAIALDDFLLNQHPQIWQNYLQKTIKRMIRPTTITVLESWHKPMLFIGEITAVEERYVIATDVLTKESYHIRRENDRVIPEGMFMFTFLVPDGTLQDGYMLAVSTLIFFAGELKPAFEQLANDFTASQKTTDEFMKDEHLNLWLALTKAGYTGAEFTSFETNVLQQVEEFLTLHERSGDKLLPIIEDFLVEERPAARKEAAIAAGAIRFANEAELIVPITMTIKDMAAHFGVSASSLTKYYQAIKAYYEEA